jgi:inorganic phosphate transporter, PiT family
VILAQGLTVHFFTIIRVPGSTWQAVVGAVVGVGPVKGVNTIKRKTLFGIFTGWFLAPPLACFIAMCIDFALPLKYIPHQ